MLWSVIHATLEKPLVAEGEIDGEALCRGGDGRDKEPAWLLDHLQ
jgi:hypothetical protein